MATADSSKRKWWHWGRRLSAVEYRLWAVGLTIYLTIANVQRAVPWWWYTSWIVSCLVVAHMNDDGSAYGDPLVDYATFMLDADAFLIFGIRWWVAILWVVTWSTVWLGYAQLRQHQRYRLVTLVRVSIPCVGWLILADAIAAFKLLS